MEPVTIIMTTYQRTALASRTLIALRDHLVYPDCRWIIADDGSETAHVDTLRDILAGLPVQVTDAARGGVGKSKNIALREAFKTSPYVLLLEDDWELSRPLDLQPYVTLLREDETVGMIRMGYLGALDRMTCYYRGNAAGSYFELAHRSDFYVYSGQVSLRHRRFYDALGYHAEGTTAGQEEENLCWRYNQAENPPKILWPGNFSAMFNTGYFNNIGLGESLNGVTPT